MEGPIIPPWHMASNPDLPISAPSYPIPLLYCTDYCVGSLSLIAVSWCKIDKCDIWVVGACEKLHFASITAGIKMLNLRVVEATQFQCKFWTGNTSLPTLGHSATIFFVLLRFQFHSWFQVPFLPWKSILFLDGFSGQIWKVVPDFQNDPEFWNLRPPGVFFLRWFLCTVMYGATLNLSVSPTSLKIVETIEKSCHVDCRRAEVTRSC